MINHNDKIYVAGHRGLVGSAIVRSLERQGYTNIIGRTHRELDLTDQAAVRAFFDTENPDVVILAAAKVGGINANNTQPAMFAYENMQIQCNVINESHKHNVKKLLFLGSTCIYPRMAPQPIPEDALLTGPLEETNEAYAIAKISGLEMCKFYKRQYGDNYISCMPTNLYGPGDNYDIVNGHVLPTLIRKFETMKDVVPLWGTGSAVREFLHVDDLASACLFALNLADPPDLMNVGSGEEVTIRELAEAVKAATGSTARIEWDSSKPDGTPRKLCDTKLIRSLGWTPKISLSEGLRMTVASYRSELREGRIRL